MFTFPFANAITVLSVNQAPLLAGLAKGRAAISAFATSSAAKLNLAGAAVGRGMAGIGRGVGGLASGALGAASGLAVARLYGGSALTVAAGGLLKLASDAEEMEARFRQVFRDQADEAAKFADELGRELGRSKHALMDMLTNFQLEFTASGLGRVEARQMSETLQQLTIDLAAFHNMAEEDVGSRLFRALTGNHRALYELGVVMNTATLKEEALRMGWKKQWSELSNLEKMHLRLAFVMRASSDAHGQAAREAQNIAGRWRALWAELKELGIAIGTAIMPPFREFLSLLVDGIHQAREFWQSFIGGAQQAEGVLGGLAATMRRLSGEFHAGKQVRDLEMGRLLAISKEWLVFGARATLPGGTLSGAWETTMKNIAKINRGAEELMFDRFMGGPIGGQRPLRQPNIPALGMGEEKQKKPEGPRQMGLVEFSKFLTEQLGRKEQEQLLNVNQQQLGQLQQINAGVGQMIRKIDQGEAMVAPD
jgi:hypothetical protein